MNDQPDHSQGSSSAYRAYIVGNDGRFERSVDIVADTDEAAMIEAQKLNHTREVELWDRSRMIARFKIAGQG